MVKDVAHAVMVTVQHVDVRDTPMKVRERSSDQKTMELELAKDRSGLFESVEDPVISMGMHLKCFDEITSEIMHKHFERIYFNSFVSNHQLSPKVLLSKKIEKRMESPEGEKLMRNLNKLARGFEGSDNKMKLMIYRTIDLLEEIVYVGKEAKQLLKKELTLFSFKEPISLGKFLTAVRDGSLGGYHYVCPIPRC